MDAYQKLLLKSEIAEYSILLLALPEVLTDQDVQNRYEYQLRIQDLSARYDHDVLGVTCKSDIAIRNRLCVMLANELKQPRSAIRALELSIGELEQRLKKVRVKKCTETACQQLEMGI